MWSLNARRWQIQRERYLILSRSLVDKLRRRTELVVMKTLTIMYQSDVEFQENSSNPSQLVLRDRERYRQPNSLCLNLNSFPLASPPSKLKDTTSGSVGKTQKPAGSKRSGVNVIDDENSAKIEKPAANIILEELNLGCLASSLRKPRKRVRRSDSIPNTGGSKKGMPCLKAQ